MADNPSLRFGVSEWLITIGGICAFIFRVIYLPLQEDIDSGHIWWKLANVALIFLGGTGLLFVILKLWASWRDRKKARSTLETYTYQAERLLEELRELNQDPDSNYMRRECVIEDLQRLAERLRETPSFLAAEAKLPLSKIENTLGRMQEAIQLENRQTEEREKARKAKFSRQTDKSYQAFLEQDHTRTIPESCKNFDHHAIDTAKKWFENYKTEQRRIERERSKNEEDQKDALKFVWKHHALPSDYPEMSTEQKANYDEAMLLLKSGQLKNVINELREEELEERRKDYMTNHDYVQLAGSVEAGKKREKELVGKDFYFAPELKEAEQSFLLKFHGFKKFKVSDFGERLLPALYRCSERNESPNHFCTKYLFARLHPCAKIEEKDWWGNEVDILFSKGRQKLAVEIERGTNKPADVKDKVSSLCRAKYAKIILVVPRDVLPKYRQYHDGKLVFVSTAKQAKETILEWLR